MAHGASKLSDLLKLQADPLPILREILERSHDFENGSPPDPPFGADRIRTLF